MVSEKVVRVVVEIQVEVLGHIIIGGCVDSTGTSSTTSNSTTSDITALFSNAYAATLT